MQSLSTNRYILLWIAAIIVAGVAGAGMAYLVVPVVHWKAAAAGWLVAVLSSLAGRMLNDRAVGRSGKAFIGWGLVANSFRVLTLVCVFAFMAFHHPNGRGSFFVTVFMAIFVMTGVEVASLFRAQNKVGKQV